jgi:two-component system, OmpR family, sensor kinase
MRMELPLSFKLPAVAAAFLIVISVFISQQVLSRLGAIQSDHLKTLAGVHLDGLTAALSDAVLREDVWEVFAILDRSRQGMEGVRALETVVANSDGQVIAASDPRALAPGAALPPDYDKVRAASERFVMDEPSSRAFARRDILYNGQPIGTVFARLDIAELLADRVKVLTTLIATNVVLTLIAVVVAWLTVRRMMRPVAILAANLEDSVSAAHRPIAAAEIDRAGPEFKRLFRAYNTMVAGLDERDQLERKVAEEERLASLGRLASSMAHEINNPLGGIFNALDTLKHHGDKPEVQMRSISLIERGLKGIRDVVRSTLMTWRLDREIRLLEMQDFEDLKVLAGPDIRHRNLELDWDVELGGDIDVPASEVRQIVLNLLLNACRASEPGSKVAVRSRASIVQLVIEIVDSGPGMPDYAMKTLTDPSAAPSPFASGHGLGLWTTRRLVSELGGTIAVETEPGKGTSVTVSLPRDAIREHKNAA